jgi:chromosome partitioning protein
MQHGIRSDRPVKAYLRWMEKIPGEYRESVLRSSQSENLSVDTDPYCLATLKHYRSLMPLAMEAHKPMFFLKPADGAIGAHVEAVRDCFRDTQKLAIRIGEMCSLPIHDTGVLG